MNKIDMSPTAPLYSQQPAQLGYSPSDNKGQKLTAQLFHPQGTSRKPKRWGCMQPFVPENLDDVQNVASSAVAGSRSILAISKNPIYAKGNLATGGAVNLINSIISAIGLGKSLIQNKKAHELQATAHLKRQKEEAIGLGLAITSSLWGVAVSLLVLFVGSCPHIACIVLTAAAIAFGFAALIWFMHKEYKEMERLQQTQQQIKAILENQTFSPIERAQKVLTLLEELEEKIAHRDLQQIGCKKYAQYRQQLQMWQKEELATYFSKHGLAALEEARRDLNVVQGDICPILALRVLAHVAKAHAELRREIRHKKIYLAANGLACAASIILYSYQTLAILCYVAIASSSIINTMQNLLKWQHNRLVSSENALRERDVELEDFTTEKPYLRKEIEERLHNIIAQQIDLTIMGRDALWRRVQEAVLYERPWRQHFYDLKNAMLKQQSQYIAEVKAHRKANRREILHHLEKERKWLHQLTFVQFQENLLPLLARMNPE